MTPLRKKMIADMQLRRFSANTQESYLRAVFGLARYYRKSPDKINASQLKNYVLFLTNERNLRWSTINTITAGLRFFYTETLGRKDMALSIPPRKTPRHLPEILSKSELLLLFSSVKNHKHRAILITAYACGLRIGEVTSLKVNNIDSSRMMVRIEHGKGDKDRYSIVSPRLLKELRSYWRVYRPKLWLFPNEKTKEKLTRSTPHLIFKAAKKKAAIKKNVTFHSLRHYGELPISVTVLPRIFLKQEWILEPSRFFWDILQLPLLLAISMLPEKIWAAYRVLWICFIFQILKVLSRTMVMTEIITEDVLETPQKWELADIFREFGYTYRKAHTLLYSHLKVMRDIEVCRTSYLGGHMKVCSLCGYEHPSYNSCGNRHCPKCQSLAKVRWVKKREEELLPVDYFHNVFTLPHKINVLARSNKKALYDILFKSVSETLLEFGENGLGGKIGFISILHTWDQKLLEHIHLHCIISAGALSADKKRWISPSNPDFLFSVKALSKVFRGKFLDYLKKAYTKGELTFAGKSLEYESKEGFSALIDGLYKVDWIVYSKKPFAGPKKVLDYLGRYAFRTAISNERIRDVKDGKVTFTYRDRRDNNRLKDCTVSVEEFIRRFLGHVLPSFYTRIRHFGFLSNRNRKQNISCLKKLLGVSGETEEMPEQSMEELMLELTGKDLSKCPRCKVGTMTIHHLIPRFTIILGRHPPEPEIIDTS